MTGSAARIGKEWRGPVLICVGPQRTASSWLDRALRAHPRLVLPCNVKETHFFDRWYERGMDWYLSHFRPPQDGDVLAEVDATCFESREARERIQSAVPDVRILITVRNPIARTFSSYGHDYAKGRASGDFFAAVAAKPRIVDSGRYGVLAPEWESAFGRDRVFYMVQEDIELDPQGQLDAVCGFLGVERVPLSGELRGRYGQGTVPRFPGLAAVTSHSASALRGVGLHRMVEAGKRLGLRKVYSGGDRKALMMTPPVFDHLLAEHEADIRFLEKRLGRSFQHWRDPASYDLEEQ